jgi:hypothetical protein
MVAAQHRKLLEEEVNNMDDDQLLNTAIHQLCNYFADKCKFTIPVLQRDKIYIDQREAQIDISSERNRYLKERGRPFLVTGTLVEVFVPFEGDPECFHMQPSTFTFHPPFGDIEENVLIFYIEGVDLVADVVRSQIQKTITEVMQNLRYLQTDADRFNGNLYSYANALVEQRRKKLLTDRNLVAGLGFTLRARSEVPPVPEVRRRLTPTLPPPNITSYKAEPALAVQDYEQILEILQNTAQLLSFSPSILTTIDEEALRSHFLVQLNAHFDTRSSETFKFEGPSDILLRADGKNVFMAECKFWSGSRAFAETLNQLLGYESWRDAKVALIIFNRTKEFPQVLAAIRATIKSHSNFKRQLPQLSETTIPFVFAHRVDRSREMTLTVLAFDVPMQE